MTEAEESELRTLGSDLAAAMHSPWEPRCISRAFARPQRPALFVFTMQVWADLDAARSPLLQGEWPAAVQECDRALEIFGHDPDGLTADETAAMTEDMLGAVREGFALALRMSPPDAAAGGDEPDGFGAWLPLFACLVTQCGLSLADALACPVGQAFGLIAASRRNQGWLPQGVLYALREINTAED